MRGKVQVTTRLPEQLYKSVRKMGIDTDQPFNALLAKACENLLDQDREYRHGPDGPCAKIPTRYLLIDQGNRGLSLVDRCILVYLRSVCQADQPSKVYVAEVARDLGTTRKTVYRALRVLETRRIISREGTEIRINRTHDWDVEWTTGELAGYVEQ